MTGRAARVGALITVACLAGGAALAQTPASVRVAAIPSLVNCSGKACFRLLLNAYDAKGDPVPVSPDAQFEIVEVGAPAAPASAPTEPGGAAATRRWQHKVVQNLGTATQSAATQQGPAVPRYLFLVVDTSGSMLEPVAGGTGTKFQAAVDAIRSNFLSDFQAGTDHIAIVGFDSKRVRARISGADFAATKDAADAQLSALAPSRKGNTALYSAVDASLDEMKALAESGKAAGAQVQLLIFTDGKNDVRVSDGDDEGLLEGAGGLAKVEAKVRTIVNTLKGLEVFTIGLGDPGRTYDPEALRRLAFPDAGNAKDATGVSELKRAFEGVRLVQMNRVFLTFGPVRGSKDEITSPLVFTVTMRMPAGTLSAQSPTYSPPPIGVPIWDDNLTPAENLSYLKWVTDQPKTTTGVVDGWPAWLVRLVVFATFALTLAVLWFGLPRLIWPERYVPRPSFQVAPAPAARTAARAPAGRHATQKGVTITGRASPQRGGAPQTVAPSRIREGTPDPPPSAPPAPPARPRGAPPAPPQRPAREPFVRNAGDATVFVPPNQNRGGGGEG